MLVGRVTLITSALANDLKVGFVKKRLFVSSDFIYGLRQPNDTPFTL